MLTENQKIYYFIPSFNPKYCYWEYSFMKGVLIMNKIKKWIFDNIVAIILVVIFVPIFVVSQHTEEVLTHIGTTGIKYLNGEYYRWLTCIFYHFNFEHIFFNSIGLIAVGSLVSPFIGKIRTIGLFLMGGALAEVAYSLSIDEGVLNYGGGSSGAIFSLIAIYIVCILRYPDIFRPKWYRIDLIITVIYFVFANDNASSFLTHSFGFIAGIIMGTILAVLNILLVKRNTI